MTLAQVDPAILTCWEEMLKRGEECSLLLKHSKGRVTFSLQCAKPAQSSSVAEISPAPMSSAKKKEKKRKQKRRSKKRLEALLSYHQRLVEEKGLPPSRLMLQHAGAAEARQKCDQCDFSSASQRKMKEHTSQLHTTQSFNGELKARVACLEKAMKDKDEMLELLTASKDSLEKDAIDRAAQIDKYQRVIVGMDKVIKSKEKEEPAGQT